MRVFFDTNILLDIALKKRPEHKISNQAFLHIIKNEIKIFISWHTVSNTLFLLKKDLNEKERLIFLEKFLSVAQVSKTGHSEVLSAFEYNSSDFKDAMQITSALACEAEIIITRDKKGFRKSPIKALSPNEFLQEVI